jgi:hypothetical protein
LVVAFLAFFAWIRFFLLDVGLGGLVVGGFGFGVGERLGASLGVATVWRRFVVEVCSSRSEGIGCCLVFLVAD